MAIMAGIAYWRNSLEIFSVPNSVGIPDFILMSYLFAKILKKEILWQNFLNIY